MSPIVLSSFVNAVSTIAPVSVPAEKHDNVSASCDRDGRQQGNRVRHRPRTLQAVQGDAKLSNLFYATIGAFANMGSTG